MTEPGIATIEQSIGATPLIRLGRITRSLANGAAVLVKLDAQNPGFSVKDRIARAMIEDAEARGVLNPQRPSDVTIIEPTSGNTGIGLAVVSAARGYRCVLTMPATVSLERRCVLRALGASVVLTPGPLGMAGAIAKAKQLAETTPHAWMPMQFDNPANADAHYRTTGPEIWGATGGRVDAFVAGVGTGGTVTGVGRYLLERNPAIKIYPVEPAESPVLVGGAPGPHMIQGIGAGFVPAVFDRKVVTGHIEHVTGPEAVAMARRLAAEEGILCGISSGAAVAAAMKIAELPESAGKTIVAMLPDGGERYLSTVLFDGLRREMEKAPVESFTLVDGKVAEAPPATACAVPK